MNSYTRAIKNRRKNFINLTIKQRKEIIDIYKSASEDIVKRLERANKRTLNERYLRVLKIAIEDYRKELNRQLNKAIRKQMLAAADLGVEPSKEYFENMDIPLSLKQSFKSMFANVSDDVVKILVSGEFYKDGKTLSSRIWNITKRNGSEIDKIIKVAIAEQKSTNQLAKELEKFINSGVGTKQLTKIPGISSDISYQAVRLARTSIAHAFNEGSVHAAMDNPFNIGLKWNLSGSHSSRLARFGKTRDICDEYAESNKYKLGVGVFPPEHYPISHPNCLCYSTEVIQDLEDSSKEIIRWINGEKNKNLDKWAKRNGFNI